MGDPRCTSDRGLGPELIVDRYWVDVAAERPREPTSAELVKYLGHLEMLYAQAMRSGHSPDFLKSKGGVIAVAGHDVKSYRDELSGLSVKERLKRQNGPIRARWDVYETFITEAIAYRHETWPVLREFFAIYGTQPEDPLTLQDQVLVNATGGHRWEEDIIRVRHDWNTLMTLPERAPIGMAVVGLQEMVWPTNPSIQQMNDRSVEVQAVTDPLMAVGAARAARGTTVPIPQRIDSVTTLPAPSRSSRLLELPPPVPPAASPRPVSAPLPAEVEAARMTTGRSGAGSAGTAAAPDPAALLRSPALRVAETSGAAELFEPRVTYPLAIVNPPRSPVSVKPSQDVRMISDRYGVQVPVPPPAVAPVEPEPEPTLGFGSASSAYITPGTLSKGLKDPANPATKPSLSIMTLQSTLRYTKAISIAADPQLVQLWIESLNESINPEHYAALTRMDPDDPELNALERFVVKIALSDGRDFSQITSAETQAAWALARSKFNTKVAAKGLRNYDDIHHAALKSLFPQAAFDPANLYPISREIHGWLHTMYGGGTYNSRVMPTSYIETLVPGASISPDGKCVVMPDGRIYPVGPDF